MLLEHTLVIRQISPSTNTGDDMFTRPPCVSRSSRRWKSGLFDHESMSICNVWSSQVAQCNGIDTRRAVRCVEQIECQECRSAELPVQKVSDFLRCGDDGSPREPSGHITERPQSSTGDPLFHWFVVSQWCFRLVRAVNRLLRLRRACERAYIRGRSC